MVASANLQKLVITMPVKSGITRDSIQLDLHYTRPATVTDTDYDNITSHIEDFFTSAPTTFAAALQTRLGNVLSTTTACSIRFYEVPTTPGDLGAPVKETEFSLTGTGSTSLPEEVAACLSFRTDYGSAVEFGPSTRPRARLRNRIYLGPLAVAAINQDSTTKRVFVHDDLIEIATGAAIEFLYTAAFGDEWLWRVFSPTAWVDNPVTFVSMDNAIDIQRRRGPDPTARAEAPVA